MGKIYFAPMEGVTDSTYRQVIEKLYPQWDALFSDFLRVPAVGRYPEKHIKKHFGLHQWEHEIERKKTILQILTAPDALTEQTVQQIQTLEIPFLDLNLGCPSKTVNRRAGGAALLGTPDELWPLLSTIRKNFHGHFSVKMRLGLSCDKNFIPFVKKIADLGIDSITVHARTRDGMYKVPAQWHYIKEAVQAVNIPIIGNGDIWNALNAKQMLDSTNCYGVMVARGAMKSPWIVSNFKRNHFAKLEAEELLLNIQEYFRELTQAYEKVGLKPLQIHRQFKNLGRYIFDELPDGATRKRNFLLSQNFNHMMDIIFFPTFFQSGY